uniref:Putative disease resistance protein RGA4 isoform X2 n=1 Tax=Populus alba TaxID=43335 RepID=A0A4U5Q000_POPAL|nr:putative disease resistance protein RGA4 isoform X2 [Populus alba]
MVGINDQLWKLNGTVTRIKAVIQDAEEQAQKQKQNHQIEDWLKKLREAVYDAEDLLDDFSTQVLRKQLMPGKRVSREVRLFFSRSNQFVYGSRMGHRVKALRERLDGIEIDSKKFNFVRGEERASLTTEREQTTSSEPEITVGRESDKAAVKIFLMNSNYEHNVSVISVVGMGGLGKTTLAQHVFNDEQVKAHFGVRLWVSVSGGLDVRKIIKGAVGTGDSDDQLESLKEKLERKIEKKKLPRDAVGSKIVVTTRSHVIAKFTSTIEPHVLKGLSVDESWELFRRKAFPQGQESGHVDERIRKEIVGRCGGVPLVVKAIARRLRVLVLSDFGMKEVSPLIEKIKHLKYLDLSNNEMDALSNSVTSLVNLQVLKLNGCINLKELPRDISKLISLRHLDVGCTLDDDLCVDLEYMPRGIGKLTSLQTLSCFVVAEKESPKSEMIGGLDELGRLNELRGRLEIKVMGYEDGSCISEFEGANLIDKEYLQQLRVEGYGGMRFPSWVSHLSNLVSIVLEDCGRLKHIPPLDGIPFA